MLETQVLIVGAGPVGQMAALLLSHHGISSLIVDRRFERMTAPKAHAVNSRTLEICESVGLSAETVRATGAPPNEAGWVRFVSQLNGVEFGHLPYERQQDDVKELSPYPLTNIAQPDFEALVAGTLQDRSNVALLRGCECKQLHESDDGVVADLSLRGNGGDVQVKAQYVVAADGANSSIRSALNIGLEGPEGLQHNMMIHFEADLRAITAKRPGILHFLFDPDSTGVLIAFDVGKTWVLMHSFDPSTQSPDSFDDATCIALVEKAVGEKLPDIRIKNAGPWTMCAQVATQYRKGRIFLVGDAAHRFPPTGGLGLNTGVVDAQNIAWKIAAVENGWAGPELLDTYEAERRPIAQINTEQSLENAAKLFDLFGALYGPDPEKARAHFDDICADPDAVKTLASAVEAQRPHFDSLNLQLGYRYTSSAIIDPAPAQSGAAIDISAYVPSYEAGASLPHRWVSQGGQDKSLLSLLSPSRFTLIAGPEGGKWREAAAGGSAPTDCLIAGEDFQDDGAEWTALTGLPADGALLVRPDAHIALRCDGAQQDAVRYLSEKLTLLLKPAN